MKKVRYGDLEIEELDDGFKRARKLDRTPLTNEEKKIAQAIINDDVREALRIFKGYIKEVK